MKRINVGSTIQTLLRMRPRLSVDNVIMTSASLVLAISLFFLFEDGYFFQDYETANLTAVGTFKTSSNDVRRRVDSGMTWSNVDAPDKVYEGDSIFTGDKSEASITLTNGTVIKIDAKSLVVIRTKGNRTEIDLQYGSLQGKIGGKDPIFIIQNGQEQDLGATAGSQIRIVKTEKSKSVRVQVTEGELNLKNKDQKPTARVLKDEVVQVFGAKDAVVEKSTITLLSPVDGDPQWLALGAPLKFSWRSKGEAAKRARLEFARENHFDSPFYSAEVSGNAHSVSDSNVPEGSFYWRVKPDKGDASLPALATAYPDVPPLPVLPKDKQVFLLDKERDESTKTVFFTWDDKSGSTQYSLQISSDEEFNRIVKSHTGKEKVERVADLAAGTYFWRVTGRHPQRDKPPFSRMMSFTIRDGAQAPKAPIVASNELYYTIPNSALARIPASVAASGRGVKPSKMTPFSWSPIENAASYEVEVALDNDFSNSVRYENSASTSFSPKEVRPGAMFMRVRGTSTDGRVSPASAPTKLNVMLEAPRMEKVQPSVSTFKTPDELSKASHEFHLAWNRQTFADSYELQWATDSTFSKSKKFRVREAQRNLKVTKAQGYAARVRSLSATGEPISPFSEVEVTSFNKELFVPAPVVAKALLPKVDASRDPASNMLGGLVSTIPMPQLKEPAQETALISLEDAPTFVTFRWKSFKGAAYYTIQISEDADFTKVVTESRSDRNTYVFQKALPEGKVFWRVRAHIKKGYSVWSDPYDINVIYQ